MFRAAIWFLSFVAMVTLMWWRAWSCSVGEAMTGREMSHAESFQAFFFNQWPEEKGGG